MKWAILFVFMALCHCFEHVSDNSRPLVEDSTLTFYTDESGDYLLSFGGIRDEVISNELWRFSVASLNVGYYRII